MGIARYYNSHIVYFFILTTTFLLYKCYNLKRKTYDDLFAVSNFELLKEKKYITSTYKDPGRLGNILFRFASLYGIGQEIKRLPYFDGNNVLQIKAYPDFADAFPLLSELIEIRIPNKSETKVVDFSDECCKYENPLKINIKTTKSNIYSEEFTFLMKYDDIKYLTLSANFLHSYKFFNKFRYEIKQLMECSDGFKKEAEKISKTIWEDDEDSHKLCIHVRREDFVINPTLKESEYDFIISATNFIYHKLKQEYEKISLTIINNDAIFSHNLTFPNLVFTSINVLQNNSAALDMCFASKYCESFLNSASASTYAWWIGNLMENQRHIYYNLQMAKTAEGEKRFSVNDYFYPHWKSLRLLENGTIIQSSTK